jgi:aryl-alcohol dehydrogenase-like predicted oxidoreductase
MRALDDATVGTVSLGDRKVRRLGFGAMRISGARDAEGVRDRETARALVRGVTERGVNLIDTADIYGYGESEEIIAEALHPYPPGLVIATKAGYRPGKILPGHVVLPPEGDPEHIKRQCDESLRRLRVDVIDLYQVHCPDPRVPYAETVGAFKELQDEGKVRHIGVSNVQPFQLELAQSICEVVSVQNRYNAGDRGSEAVLDICTTQGIAFMPYAPMLVGNHKAVAVLEQIAASHGAIEQQVALAWLLQRSPVMLPIPGTSQLAHANENVDAAWLRLSADDLDEVDKVL